MDREDQLEIRAEMDEQVTKELAKVCAPDEVLLMKEWIEEETNFHLYWKDSTWINTKTNDLVSTDSLYKLYKKSTLVGVVDGGI